MIGQLIGAGASILGGLFGSKKQKTESSVNYVQMAQNAEAAGFNPLTVLRNGGSAGFTSTVHHPGLSALGDAISSAGSSFGAALDERLDPIAQKKRAVESALYDYQLGALQSAGKPRQMFGDVPTKQGLGRVLQSQPPLSRRSSSSASVPLPGSRSAVRARLGLADDGSDLFMTEDAAKDGHTNLNIPGLLHDPRTVDADLWEQRYGEPGGIPGAIYVGKRDFDFTKKLYRVGNAAREKSPYAASNASTEVQVDRAWREAIGLPQKPFRKEPRVVTTW